MYPTQKNPALFRERCKCFRKDSPLDHSKDVRRAKQDGHHRRAGSMVRDGRRLRKFIFIVLWRWTVALGRRRRMVFLRRILGGWRRLRLRGHGLRLPARVLRLPVERVCPIEGPAKRGLGRLGTPCQWDAISTRRDRGAFGDTGKNSARWDTFGARNMGKNSRLEHWDRR